jgi:hypothetical protein
VERVGVGNVVRNSVDSTTILRLVQSHQKQRNHIIACVVPMSRASSRMTIVLAVTIVTVKKDGDTVRSQWLMKSGI